METFHEASMNVYFIRHGQTDYSLKDQKIYQGFGVNLAPLSEEGIRQIEEAAKDGPFLSKEDFRNRTKVSKTICDLMAELGILGDLPETNQLSLFDL